MSRNPVSLSLKIFDATVNHDDKTKRFYVLVLLLFPMFSAKMLGT